MNFLESVRVLRRRWLVVAGGVVVTVLVAGGAYAALPTSYQAKTEVLLLPSPADPSQKGLVNPYLNISSTMQVTADILRLAVTDAQSRQKLTAQGVTASYGVALSTDTSGPVLTITGTDKGSAPATRAVGAVVADLRQELVGRQEQAGAPRSTWISVSTFAADPRAVKQTKGKIRAALALLAVGIVVTLFVAFWRERRRGAPAAPPPPAAAPDAPPPPVAAPAVPAARRRRVPAPNDYRVSDLGTAQRE